MTMLFMNVTWMEKYDGINAIDNQLRGGGTWVDEQGYGHEIYNFREIDGRFYGYAQAWPSIHIERLGADKTADKIDGITVVFTAKSPNKNGVRIVGWYENATVYREWQPSDSERRRYGDEPDPFGFFVEAKAKDAQLLNHDERFIFPPVPKGKGGQGQSSLWYAESEIGEAFKKTIAKKIAAYKNGTLAKKKPAKRKTDVESNLHVEKTAINTAWKHFEDMGCVVRSVEEENLGWDLEATYLKKVFRIEVKGRSGKDINAELTPNEYEKMNSEDYRDSFILAIVTDCKGKPTLHCFSYDHATDAWKNEDGLALYFEERVAAKCYVPEE